MNLQSFINQARALQLYRQLIKIAPSHARVDWIKTVRDQFEENKNVDQRQAETLIAYGHQILRRR